MVITENEPICNRNVDPGGRNSMLLDYSSGAYILIIIVVFLSMWRVLSNQAIKPVSQVFTIETQVGYLLIDCPGDRFLLLARALRVASHDHHRFCQVLCLGGDVL